jgi:sorting nexin-27
MLVVALLLLLPSRRSSGPFSNQGFGFNIKGTVVTGGVMQPIMGRLYPPLQYVSFVDKEGAAYEGGVRLDDRILSVNGSDVTGSSHKQVVDHVLRGGDNLKLRVVRVDKEEAVRGQNIDKVAPSVLPCGQVLDVFLC